MYVYKMKHGSKRPTCSSDQDSPCSAISATSSDIVSPTAMSNSVGSSSDDVRSPGDDASPIPYKKQVLSPRVHAAFSPVTPATPDLMDIDLEELREISAMTHSWPSPGPLSPSWGKGKGKELDLHGKGKGKGKGELDLISKGKGQKGRLVLENDDKEQEQESEEVVQSSQTQTNTKPSARRGKNMAVLAKLQKNQEELDFENKSSNVLKEHDSVSSSSDSKSSKPSAEAAETVTSSLKQSPSSSSQSPQSQPQSAQNDKMKTIDEKALHEIQSVHPPPPPPPAAPVASKVLEEAGSSELEELAQTLCKSTTELELSAFVTRALDLSVATPVGKPRVHLFGQLVHVEPAEYLSEMHVSAWMYIYM